MKILSAFTGLMLFTAPVQADVMLQMPSALTANPREFWRSFMTEVYGPYNKQKKCWVSKTADGPSCMRPHTFDEVVIGGKRRVLVSVGGSRDAPNYDCHACAGYMGFYVLSPESERLSIAAQSDAHVEIGSWGVPPPEDGVTVQMISADGTHAWLVQSAYMGQGIFDARATIFAQVGTQVKDIGQLPAAYNDDGACIDGKVNGGNTSCSQVIFEHIFDTAKQGRFAPVVLRRKGVVEGQPVTDSFVAIFDETSFAYKLPPEIAN